jgi:hypothetical protein
VAPRDLSVAGEAVARLADTVSHGKEKDKYIYIYIFSFFSSFGCFQLIACFRGREIDSRREEEEEEEDRRRRWRAEEKTFYK